MPFGIGVPELIVLALIVVMIFGVGKLGDVGAAVGRSIRDFRAAVKDGNSEADKPA